ncbi:MAG: hypothetical protein JWR08_1248 [Enterovirga sp.]|nr:hypothetical protein [Enterovirga sp.]
MAEPGHERSEAERSERWASVSKERFPPDGWQIASVDESLDGNTLTFVLTRRGTSDDGRI